MSALHDLVDRLKVENKALNAKLDKLQTALEEIASYSHGKESLRKVHCIACEALAEAGKG